MTQDFPDYQP